MKKHLYSFITLLAMLFTLGSCEDVPAPYEIPGSGSGDGPDTPIEEIATGTGTLADPYNAVAATEYVKSLEADANSPTEIYIKGIVVSVKEQFSSYGNATFYIADSESSSTKFYVYRALGLGNKKCTDPNALQEGDEVIVCGTVVNYGGNTPETVQNKAYLYSINGKTEDVGTQTPDTPVTGEAKGTGTLADPFNVAAAIKKCQETGQTATAEQYYVKGKVESVNASGAAQYGNININMVDEGSSAVFMAFQINSIDGAKFTEETAAAIKAGDEVVIVGNLVNYMGNTPETTGKGAGHLVTLNGKAEITGVSGGNNPGSNDDPGDGKTIVFQAGTDKGSIDDYNNHGADQVTKNGVTLSITDGCLGLSSDYRTYKSQQMTITSTTGNIAKIVFTCTADGDAKYGPGCWTANCGNYTYEGKNGTWTGDASSITFDAAANQVRATKIVVTLK